MKTNVVSAESDVRDASEDWALILHRDLAVTAESGGMITRDVPMRAIRGALRDSTFYNKETN